MATMHRAYLHGEQVPVREYDTVETLGKLGLETFETLNTYQLTVSTANVVADPVPRELIPAEARRADSDLVERITHNRSRYAPDIEKEIAEDPFVIDLKSLRKSNISASEYAVALRSRRTTIAALALSRALN